MTDIGVTSTSFQAENRTWLVQQPGGIGAGFTQGVTLDVSAFTLATHYPNGFLTSGIVLGKITASGLYGPYDDSVSDGRQVATGILYGSIKIPNLADTTKDCGGSMLSAFAVVKESKLPIATSATGRGYIDTNGKADLPRIHFIA
jgi:hypothetical protein